MNTMHHWRQRVRKHLEACDLPSATREDVITELAAHLEETYDEALARGLDEAAAIEFTLQEVTDWRVLSADISRAKSKETTMNNRIKTLWLPAIAIVFGVGLLLLFLDRAPILQRVMWVACMALLLGVVATEANRMNLRTRSIWLPGFVSLLAASLLMFAEEIVMFHDPSFYFTDISLRPSHLISGLPRWFYIVWLLVQVPCGALGAFLSRRGGGTRGARAVAGAFPALAIFLLCGLAIPMSAAVEHNAYVLHHLDRLALGICIWAAVPAIGLLLGAAPFLRRERPPLPA
jgi:hypothetical protein